MVEIKIDNAKYFGECVNAVVSEKEVKGTFNLEFLNAMIRGCNKDSDIQITLANNKPISLSYNIGDAKLMFVLAPYIEE